MWRFSWGSFARGLGGFNFFVKLSQFLRIKREKRINLNGNCKNGYKMV